MRYLTFPPPPALRHQIIEFWVLEGDAPPNMPHRLFADACVNLVFQYRNQFTEADGSLSPDVHVMGSSSQYWDMKVTGSFGLIGVYLYPSAVQKLLGVSAAEISQAITDGSLLPDKNLLFLQEQIAASTNAFQRVQLLSNFFLKKLLAGNVATDTAIQLCLHEIIQQKGVINLRNIKADFNLSPRQFERRFYNSAGMGVGLFSRIVRFQKLLSTLPQSLTSMAYDAGYYDQSHFIRDFKTFSGLSPKAYFKLGNDEAAISFIQLNE